MKNIIVIFGGKSTEHDISIISALQVVNNLDTKKYNVIPVYINKAGIWYSGENLKDIKFFSKIDYKKLKEVCLIPASNFLFVKKFNKFYKWKKPDFVFVIMHGMNGEDGTIQGLLELCQIPYSSPNVLSSALSMDKVAMKLAFKGLNLPILPYVWFYKEEFNLFKEKILQKIENKLTYPVIVKPANLGSSIGIKICKDREELEEAISVATSFDYKVVVEKAIKNLKEINISVKGVFNDIVCSTTEEPINWQSFLSFEDKYINKNIEKRKMPAEISKNIEKRIFEIAKKIFLNFSCKGVVRIDFMIDNDTKNLYVNEINTIPGSLAFFLWKDRGFDFTKLLDDIVVCCEKEFNVKQQLSYQFNTNVLTNVTDGYRKK